MAAPHIPLHDCPAGDKFGEFGRGRCPHHVQESERLLRSPLLYNLRPSINER